MITNTLTETTLFGSVEYEYFISHKHDCRFIDLVTVKINTPDGRDRRITASFFVDNGLCIPDKLREKMIANSEDSK